MPSGIASSQVNRATVVFQKAIGIEIMNSTTGVVDWIMPTRYSFGPMGRPSSSWR